MSYFPRNDSKCAELHLKEQETHPTDLSDVQLAAYEDQEYERVLFNVTFSNIKWKSRSFILLDSSAYT